MTNTTKTPKFITTVTCLLIVLALLSSCTTLAPTQTSSAQQETINIGFIGPLSGGPALWGQGSLNMIQLAVKDINSQGGINGKQLNIIAEDGKCTATQAVAAAHKLIDVDRVKFILGGHCSPETVATVPIINESKVFLLAGVTSTDEAVSASKYAFRTSPPTLEQAKIVAHAAYNKYGYRRIALLTENAAYPKSYTADLKKEFTGTIVADITYQPLQQDFRTELSIIKESKPDAIWIAPQDPNEAVLILQQLKELGMQDIALFGSTVLIDKSVALQSGNLLPSTAWTVTLFADPQNPKSKEVQDKYRAAYNSEVLYNLYYVSAAYDATIMLSNALKECPSENVDCVQQYFADIEEYEGVAGSFTFKENGDPVFDSWKEMSIVNNAAVLE